MTHHSLPVSRLPSAVYCLIPAKPYAESKTRLAPILTPEERTALSRRLLLRTVRLAREVVGPVVVVSRDEALLEEVQAEGAWGLLEATPGLNPALAQAARFAGERGAAGVLVLPADLPLLTAADLEAILDYIAPRVPPSRQKQRGTMSPQPSPLKGEGADLSPAPFPCREACPAVVGGRGQGVRSVRPIVVVAPCRHGTGTNALLVCPPGLIPFAFGPDSFAAHCAAARAAGVEPVIYRSAAIALDLDTPEDLEEAGVRSRETGVGSQE
jgi:2-phospho-L-lactate guanylyltransferase